MLADKNCVPCCGGVPPLKGKKTFPTLHLPLGRSRAVEDCRPASPLCAAYKFPDSNTSALAFVNRVGELAEQQGHHPDILLGWGKVEITPLDRCGGVSLTESDFILAAKIDQLL